MNVFAISTVVSAEEYLEHETVAAEKSECQEPWAEAPGRVEVLHEPS